MRKEGGCEEEEEDNEDAEEEEEEGAELGTRKCECEDSDGEGDGDCMAMGGFMLDGWPVPQGASVGRLIENGRTVTLGFSSGLLFFAAMALGAGREILTAAASRGSEVLISVATFIFVSIATLRTGLATGALGCPAASMLLNSDSS